MYDLTGFQRDILYVIVGLEEPYGLKIKANLEDYYKQEVNHGRLYPNLDDLAEKGLLEKGELDKRTNIYSVTERGQREIQARRDWEDKYLEATESATS
ncbi:PadR family transcriptional regulator [Halobellus rufus]|uniref:PadR family transcriptional regulator n=1 Tax=Halobellus rufus TaxID=1448860 RepID=UPI000679239C|nr:PadR family transcriptional regulator [Halobellus rufus]